jgi:hypothetical protein
MAWAGEVKLFRVTYHGTKREAWVLSQTAEQAMDEVAGRDAVPYQGVLSAVEEDPTDVFFFVCDDPNESELVYRDTPAWEEPSTREGFTITPRLGKHKVEAPAWRWAQAYEETLDPFAFSFEPKLLCSR